MMNEDLDDFPAESKEKPPNHWFEHIAQSRLINIQEEVESQQRFHLFLVGQRPGSNTRS